MSRKDELSASLIIALICLKNNGHRDTPCRRKKVCVLRKKTRDECCTFN